MAIKGTGRLTKGYIENVATGKSRRFQYNPESFADDIAVEYRDIKSPGISYPIYQYSGGEVRTIEFTLFLDDVESKGNVRGMINFLNQFLPKANRGTNFTPPPDMIFAFGWFVKTCVLSNFHTEYTMFDKNLQPIRAEVTLTLKVVQ